MALSIQLEEGPSSTKTLRLAGRLDDETVGELDRKLDELLAGTLEALVFDLGGLEYATSAGLRAFLRAQKTMKQRSGQVLFVNVQPPVKKVFDVARTADLDTVFRSRRELDAYLDAKRKKVREEAP